MPVMKQLLTSTVTLILLAACGGSGTQQPEPNPTGTLTYKLVFSQRQSWAKEYDEYTPAILGAGFVITKKGYERIGWSTSASCEFTNFSADTCNGGMTLTHLKRDQSYQIFKQDGFDLVIKREYLVDQDALASMPLSEAEVELGSFSLNFDLPANTLGYFRQTCENPPESDPEFCNDKRENTSIEVSGTISFSLSSSLVNFPQTLPNVPGVLEGKIAVGERACEPVNISGPYGSTMKIECIAGGDGDWTLTTTRK